MFIDNILLQFFQKLAWKIQDMFGIDNFVLTKHIAILGFIFHIIRRILVSAGDTSGDYLLPFFAVIVKIFFTAIILFWMRKLKCLSGNYGLNPLSQISAFRSVRILMVLLFIFSIKTLFSPVPSSLNPVPVFYFRIKILDCLEGACDVLIFYFLVCTPKPPKKSKVKKFLESLATKKAELVTIKSSL